eukprot:UN28374
MFRQIDLVGRRLLRNCSKNNIILSQREFRSSYQSFAAKTHYETLGVSKDVDDKDLKKAFFALAKKHHPDANPDDKDASSKFSEINEAYQVLSDKNKRAEYDMFGTASGAEGGMGGMNMQEMNMNDIFENLFGMGMKQKREGTSYGLNNEPGQDIQVEIALKFDEVVKEMKKDINTYVDEKCKTCSGSGQKAGTSPVKCKHCKGSGMMTRQSCFMVMQSTCPYCHGEGFSVDPCITCSGKGLQ